MRQAIAAAMSRSKREIPHYYLSQTIDVSAAIARLEKLNATRPPLERVLPAALFLRAVALAIAKLPELNGFWEEGRFRPVTACISAGRSHCVAAAWSRRQSATPTNARSTS